MVDLRLLGIASIRRSFTEVARPLLGWSLAAWRVAVGTGRLLFISKGVAFSPPPKLKTKLFVFGVAGINLLFFDSRRGRGVQKWTHLPPPPMAARLAGGISLTCWILV